MSSNKKAGEKFYNIKIACLNNNNLIKAWSLFLPFFIYLILVIVYMYYLNFKGKRKQKVYKVFFELNMTI